MNCRQIGFEGDDAAYIRFLEARVLELQQALQLETRTRVANSLRSQGDPNEAGIQRKPGRFTNNARPIDDASERQGWADGIHPPLETRDEQRYDAEDTNSDSQTFKVIEYNPTQHKKPAPSPSREKQRQSKNLSNFAVFLDELPGSRAWLDWCSTNGERLVLLRGLVQGYSLVTPCSLSLKAPKVLSNEFSNSTETSILFEYARSIITSGIKNRQVACVQELVFVSLCAVALRNDENTEKEIVYNIMRQVLRSDAQLLQLQKLIRGARWANRAISLLSSRWKTRSWDILFVGMLFVLMLSSTG